LLLSDNGLEFKGVFSKFCDDNKIHQIHSKSHSPTDNALCENLNKFIRKIIREVFIRTNKLNWIDYLDDVVYNRNHSKQMNIKQMPYNLWTDTTSVNKDNELQSTVLNESKEKNEKLKIL
jgi:transposase InsO family protein